MSDNYKYITAIFSTFRYNDLLISILLIYNDNLFAHTHRVSSIAIYYDNFIENYIVSSIQ